MRKLFALLLVLCLCVALVACGEDDTKPTTESSAETTVATDPTDPDAPTDPTEPTEPGQSSVVSDPTKPVSTKPGETTKSTAPTKSTQTTKTTKSTATTKSGETNYDKPWAEHIALPGDPTASPYASKAKTMINSVRNAKDTIKVSGTKWYVSSLNGNDKNDGKSAATAWASLAGVTSHASSIKSGDAVLFERGSLFRGSLTLKSGVSYGAYGSGDKPCFYGSAMNYTKATWTDQGNGVWRLENKFSTDVGLIVFNHGEHVGVKKDKKTDLKSEYDFCSDRTSNRVFLKCAKNPATAFKSIEIGANGKVIRFNGLSDITVENFCIKYTGAHAFSGSDNTNITVRNCEMGYIGGSYLEGTNKVRYGNGFEIMGSSTNILLENYWMYQIYDSGATFQGLGGVVNGYTVRNNLFQYNGMGAFEYWGSTVKKAEISGNLMQFNGYGFGGAQRPDKESRAAIQSNGKAAGAATNKVEGSYVIKNNIFDQSAYQLINSTSLQNQLPTYSGNTYVQKKGGVLGYYKTATDIPFDDSVLSAIKTIVGDTTATVKFA